MVNFIFQESQKEIFISTYICHPSMANNELSGPMLAILIANYFSKKKNNFPIRLILIPETIGSIAYLSKNLDKLKKNVIFGLNLSCVGDEGNIPTFLQNMETLLQIEQLLKIIKI